MAVVSTITIGGVTYSVYALTADPVQDADDWFAARLGAEAWINATPLAQQQALISAVRKQDRAVPWSGEQTDPLTPQPLEFPRDGATCSGDPVPDGTIPDDFAHGQFEYALLLLQNPKLQGLISVGSNVKVAKAGSAEVEFFSPTLGSAFDTPLPVPVWEYVGCYSKNTAAIGGPAAYGTGDESEFSCPPDLNRAIP